MSKQEVSKVKKNELDRPSYVEAGDAGLEDVRPQDVMLPRLAIMQSLTPSVVEGQHKAGELVNTLTGEAWVGVANEKTGEGEPVLVHPIKHYAQWIKWGDRDANEGMLEQSTDPQGALAKEAAVQRPVKDEKGKLRFAITEYHNFVITLPESHPREMVVLSFSRSSHKTGRQLIGLAKARGHLPLFAGLYKLTTKRLTKGANTYWVYVLENAGWAPEADYCWAKDQNEALKGLTILSPVDESNDEGGGEL